MIVRDVYKIIYTSNVLYHFIEISEDIEAKYYSYFIQRRKARNWQGFIVIKMQLGGRC